MGQFDTLFDEEVGGAPPAAQPPPSDRPRVPPAPRTAPPVPFTPDVFNEDVGGAPARLPLASNGVDWSRYNQPLGQLSVPDPSITERVKSYGQDALMGLGANPYTARQLSSNVVDLGGGLTPMGSVLSAGDLGYNLTRGNYGRAAIDAVGVIPGAMMVRRGIQAARGGLPMIRMADTPTRTVDPATGAVNDELLDSSRAAYGRIANAPIEYHPNAIANYAHIAQYYLQQPGPRGVFSPESAPGVFSLLNRAGNVNRIQVSPSDFETLRQQLRAFDSGPDSAAGQRAAAILENYMYHPPPGAITRMVPGAMDTLRQDMEIARGDWRAGKTAETVERTIDRSGTKAGGAHSGLNVGNTTRQDLGSLADPSIGGTDKIFGATYGERQALRAVSQGDPVTNKLRYIGNRMGGGGGFTGTFGGGIAGHTVNSLLGSWGIDPITAAGVGMGAGYLYPKVGEAFRRAANERTVQAAQDAVDLIRRNSPLYRAREAVNPPIVDPRAMTRDAIAYAMIPQLSRQAGSVWDQAHVPYDNREQP
jgi:hypothetical protein